jgi:hypothetical protein
MLSIIYYGLVHTCTFYYKVFRNIDSCSPCFGAGGNQNRVPVACCVYRRLDVRLRNAVRGMDGGLYGSAISKADTTIL